MKTYHGYRRLVRGIDGVANSAGGCVVQVCVGRKKRPLRLRLDVRNHSPTGFEWGYSGSGPAQLALALVADCCGKALARPAIYQRVKQLVAGLPHDGWVLTEEQVRAAVAEAQNEIASRSPCNEDPAEKGGERTPD